MSKLVTIGLPVYKRFEYLPNALRIVAAQDYPHIDLLVSDNGLNGGKVREIVDQYYPKPYRFRQNEATVSSTRHFNQLVENAAGNYFVVLADDDELTPNYVSELMALLEKHPDASVAMSRHVSFDDDGRILSRSADTVPERMSGIDFIRAAWGTREYGYRSFSTFLAKTQKMLDCGGYGSIWRGCGDEDILLVKLCLGSSIVFSSRCTYRKRFSESSDGWSASIHDLSRGLREFMGLLDSDPVIRRYAAGHRQEWRQAREHLVSMAYRTYHFRWSGMYRQSMKTGEWIRASMAMPYRPAYYKQVLLTILGEALSKAKQAFPHAYSVCRNFRGGCD